MLLVAVILAGCGVGSGSLSKEEYLAKGDAICADGQVEAGELARRAQEIQAQSGTLTDSELVDRASDLWSDQIEVMERYRGRLGDLDPPDGDEAQTDELLASLDEGIETARDIKATLDEDERLSQELVQAYAAIVARGNTLARAYGFQVCGRSA